MGRRIDAARQARHDDEAGLAEVARERSANFTPAAEALREPTIAIDRAAADASNLPRTARSGGASSIICKSRRIVGLAERDEVRLRCACGLRVRFGLFGGQIDPRDCAAPPRRARRAALRARRGRRRNS